MIITRLSDSLNVIIPKLSGNLYTAVPELSDEPHAITPGLLGAGDPQSDITPQPYLGQVTAKGGRLGSSGVQARGLRVRTGALRKLPPQRRHAGLPVSLV